MTYCHKCHELDTREIATLVLGIRRFWWKAARPLLGINRRKRTFVQMAPEAMREYISGPIERASFTELFGAPVHLIDSSAEYTAGRA